MYLLVVLFIVPVVLSFICSLLEAVILSVSPAYIAVRVHKGKKYGVLLNNLKRNVDRPLAAILTFNTIATTFFAAAVGAQVQAVFGNEAITAASATLTFTILVVSEIIPKTLGATYWKTLAPVAAHLIHVLIYLGYPFVLLSEGIARMLSGRGGQNVTREEMIMTAELGAKAGILNVNESSIIKNLLLLNNIFVSDIMTPRSVLAGVDRDMTVQEVMEKHRPIRFSRLPVYNKDLDHIEGLVHRYKVLEASSSDQHQKKMYELMSPIDTIEEDVPVSRALDRFIKTKKHLFLVIDEYGTTLGIVTLEDAIETLLGVEIVDEFDSVADLRQYALEQWQMRKKNIRRVK